MHFDYRAPGRPTRRDGGEVVRPNVADWMFQTEPARSRAREISSGRIARQSSTMPSCA